RVAGARAHDRRSGERAGGFPGGLAHRGERSRRRIHVPDVAHCRKRSMAKLAPNARRCDDPGVIRLACPTGCPRKIQIPFRLRAEPVRCRNCTAWLRAPLAIEDDTFVEGDLLAPPGVPLAVPATRARVPWGRVAAAAALAALVAAPVLAAKPTAKLECVAL